MDERNNQERVGLPEEIGEAPSLEKPTKNPFNFWNQTTEIIDLPSKGAFYPEGHPYASGKAEIKQMTAHHESILSNRSYMMEGVMFDKFIEDISVHPVDAKDLLAGDRSAIMVHARAEAYGNKYKVSPKCPVCGSTNHIEVTLEVPDEENDGNLKVNHGILDKDIRDLLEATYDVDNRTVTFKLNGEVPVTVRLADGHLEKSLFDYAAFKKKYDMGDISTVDQMVKSIVAIGEFDTKSDIEPIVETMPANMASYWRSAYKTLSPSIDIFVNNECTNEYCDNILKQEVGLTPEFFWPKPTSS